MKDRIPSRLVSETRLCALTENADLLIRSTRSNDIVALTLLLPMGSREEVSSQAGIGTLALGMLSRGTQRKTDYELAVALESIGASFSTDVQKDRASISMQTTRPQLQRSLDLLEEILLEPTFPREEFEVEKAIQIQEIREDLDSPFTAAYRLFQETFFKDHPYARHASGSEETVGRLTHGIVRADFEKRFGCGPLVFAVVGNAELDEVRPSLTRIAERIAKGAPAAREPIGGPCNGKVDSVYRKRTTESESVIYGFPAPGVLDDSYPTWKVLDSIMGGSMDSRLFDEIREKRGLVYQIGSTYPPLEWGSVFIVSLVSTVQNHDEVLECLDREIDRLKTTLADPDEIGRAKTYLQGTFLMSQEKNRDQTYLLARTHSLGLGVDYIDRYPQLLDEVTPESIRQAARGFLIHPTIAIVGPGNGSA
jgi:predicted Zn-dependent peptidase